MNVGRGANVEEASGMSAVCANEVVGAGLGVSVVELSAVASSVADVAVANGIFVGAVVTEATALGVFAGLEVAMIAVDVLVTGMLANPCSRSCASCVIG